jgi:hypothetical protein
METNVIYANDVIYAPPQAEAECGGRLQSGCKRVGTAACGFRVAPQGASPTALQHVINVIYAARSSMRRRCATAHTLAPWSTP